MTIEILMPALSPTMTEGSLNKWLVKVGDKVKAGDVLVEIETDKATMEVEAVDEGIISEILIKEGTTGVSVNSPIALIMDKFTLFPFFEYFNIDSADLITEGTVATLDINGDQ